METKFCVFEMADNNISNSKSNSRTSEQAIKEQQRLRDSLESDVEGANERIRSINTELTNIVDQLGEAKVDKHENARSHKKAELIDNLKRLFTGVVSLLSGSILLGGM